MMGAANANIVNRNGMTKMTAPYFRALAGLSVAGLVSAWAAAHSPATESANQGATPNQTAVGIVGKIEQLKLAGSELEVIPLTDKKTPLVVRIADVRQHGTGFRYDIEYMGLEAGAYDLKNYLRRKDGSPLGDIPSIAVEVRSVLPAKQFTPHELESKSSPWVGGYRMVWVLGGLAWLVGMYAILFAGRRRKAATESAVRPATLADRLRPLVEKGIAGQLSPEATADLERALIGYWKRRLQLQGLTPSEVFVKLRQHPEAGPLLSQLEHWLHRPGPHESVNLADLLSPYRHLPADALDSVGVAV